MQKRWGATAWVTKVLSQLRVCIKAHKEHQQYLAEKGLKVLQAHIEQNDRKFCSQSLKTVEKQAKDRATSLITHAMRAKQKAINASQNELLEPMRQKYAELQENPRAITLSFSLPETPQQELFKAMRNSVQQHDVQLICEGDKRITLHSALIKSLPFFKPILFKHGGQSLASEIEQKTRIEKAPSAGYIIDLQAVLNQPLPFSAAVLESLVDFIYFQPLNNPQLTLQQALQLYQLAEEILQDPESDAPQLQLAQENLSIVIKRLIAKKPIDFIMAVTLYYTSTIERTQSLASVIGLAHTDLSDVFAVFSDEEINCFQSFLESTCKEDREKSHLAATCLGYLHLWQLVGEKSDPRLGKSLLEFAQEHIALAAVSLAQASGCREGIDYTPELEALVSAAAAKDCATAFVVQGCHAGSDYAAGKLFARAGCDSIDGQARYGNCLLEGKGPAKDIAQGLRYLQEACNSGSTYAAHQLANVYKNGTIVPRDPLKAFFYFELAARSRKPDAFYDLACCYRDEIGVAFDDAFVRYYFAKEVAHGGTRSKQPLMDEQQMFLLDQ